MGTLDVNRIIHICQSIEGALHNWDKLTWLDVATQNGMTVNECKERFKIMKFEGKKVIPLGEACKGFSYIDGCPGHTNI